MTYRDATYLKDPPLTVKDIIAGEFYLLNIWQLFVCFAMAVFQFREQQPLQLQRSSIISASIMINPQRVFLVAKYYSIRHVILYVMLNMKYWQFAFGDH